MGLFTLVRCNYGTANSFRFVSRWSYGAAIAVTLCAGVHAADDKAGRAKKADFLPEREQAFIRPGLEFKITSVDVAPDGTVSYSFTVADRQGVGLDVAGVESPGPIVIRSVLAYIPDGERTYRAYTVRTQTSPINGASAQQAAFEQGGALSALGGGHYTYTFDTKLTADADRGATHTVAAWAQRNLTEFELGTDYSADTYDFVPDGSTAPSAALSVTDAKCNQCHGELEAHDNRTTVALCVTCHSPQSTDPDTGNTVDMATMVHKIHMGEDLPSVQAGTPYQIIGFRQSVHDYSEVVYPADVRNCQTCHIEEPPSDNSANTARLGAPLARAVTAAFSQRQAGTIANAHLINPTRAACGACHDEVNFPTGENHASGIPQPNDTECSRCHVPEGQLEFDPSIKGAHTVERFSKELSGVNFEILGVAGTSPGQNPIVDFAIRDDAGTPISPEEMGRLALVLTGRTGGDFSQFWSENATSATGSNDSFRYTFETTIPEDAMGTWAVGVEGYKNATLLGGTVQERSVRDAGDNVVSYFDLAGGPASRRRAIVAQEKCDSCHLNLDLHGSNRNNVEHCVLCHNPMITDQNRRPAETGAAESVNFKEMIHRIHAGEEQIRDYTIYGFGNRPHNYNAVKYPQTLANCSACHLDGTESLPLATDLLPTTDPRGLFEQAQPATGACLSCHTKVSAAAHADLNISGTFGESCDVCHGSGAEFSVERSHAR